MVKGPERQKREASEYCIHSRGQREADTHIQLTFSFLFDLGLR